MRCTVFPLLDLSVTLSRATGNSSIATYVFCQALDARILQQVEHSDFLVESLLQLYAYPHQTQGIPTEIKEIAVSIDS